MAGPTSPCQRDISAIRFQDGDAYDRGMSPWSQLAGHLFLDWLEPPAGLRWLDVGCGTGAFTELLIQRRAPTEIQAIDPNEAQLIVARVRPGTRGAEFLLGDAMALPFERGRFDAAVMALVIYFVPDPVKGVAEMARVVRPGGLVAAYGWDLLGGGHPFDPVWTEIRAAGVTHPLPPNPSAAGMQALRAGWGGAGLRSVEGREIAVERTFADFEDYWATSSITPSVRPSLDAMTPGDLARLKQRVRARLPVDATGRVTHRARANAVQGRVPT